MSDQEMNSSNADEQNSQSRDLHADSGQAQDLHADGGQQSKDRAGESSTYSWVNPKLRGGSSEQSGQNPWSSKSGDNYWHYDERNAGSSDSGKTGADGSSGFGGSGNNGSRGSGSSGTGGFRGFGSRGSDSSYGSGNPGSDPYGRNSFSGGPGGPFGGNRNQHSRKNRRKDGKKGTGARIGSVIGMALVFGAVAGIVMCAVYSIADHVRQVGRSAAAISSSSAEPESVTSSSENTKAISLQTTEQGLESSGVSDDGDMTVAEVTKACMPSVVTIATVSVEEMRDFFGGTQQYQVQGAGTGVIIGKNSTELLVATNNHVVNGAQQLTVGFADESAISATVKGSDAEHDLAVVAVSLDDITDSTMAAIRVASIGNSESLKLGDQVVVIGNALGYGQSVTSGYVSALDRTLQLSDGTNTFTSDDMIQTDAAINAGNSGGALLNMKGELVGINEAKSSYSSSGVTVDNVGYAIPMEKAKPILDNLMNQKTRDLVDEDSRGYLGASLTDVTSDYADFYHMPQGVCITQVINGGPADKCGLRRGDVITALDGASVMTFSELSDKLDYYAAGETVTITYQRSVGGHYEEQQVKAVLVSENDINQLKK